jgi:hypothetical protein
MNKRIVTALSVLVANGCLLLATGLLTTGCAHEISSEERLERETARSDAMKSSTAGELTKLRCEDINGDLAKARDESRTEEARLNAYLDMYERVKSRTAKFDDALTHNPDLAYQEGSQEIIGARDGCVQSQAEVRLDLEGLVREVMQMPTVDEIRNNTTVKVSRLNFDTLRTAIEKLDLDDKEALIAKLGNAEKQVEVKDAKRKREK